VPATGPHEDAALDLDQRPTFQMCEVGTPFPSRMEPELTLQGRPLRYPPKQVES
jgi:hypothetical protein